MASLERRGNCFRVIFRLGGRKHHVSVKATDHRDAEACRVRLEENLRLVECGRLTVPDGADLGHFLVSDGKLEKPVEIVRGVPLSELFRIYQTQFTAGANEAITREVEDIHMKHVARLIGGETQLASVTAGTIQQFVDARSKEEHNGWQEPDLPFEGGRSWVRDIAESGEAAWWARGACPVPRMQRAYSTTAYRRHVTHKVAQSSETAQGYRGTVPPGKAGQTGRSRSGFSGGRINGAHEIGRAHV